MPDDPKLSHTMRIDLIPDAPSEQVRSSKKKVRITTPTRRIRRGRPGAAQTAESHYEALLQSVYDAAVITDLNGQIVDANVRAVEFFLYEREALTSLTMLDLISGADTTLMEQLVENLEKERFTLIQAYCVRRDNSMFPAEIAVNKLMMDELRLCFFVRNITARRQQEEMLRTEHNAIQNAANGIAVADAEGRLEYVNPAVAVMWGHESADEFLGRDLHALLGEGPASAQALKVARGELETWSGEVRVSAESGREVDVQVSAVCNVNADGDPVGVIFSLMDVGDRKRAEEAERQAERHRVMLESLGAACHHLGQPATVLQANLNILKDKVVGSDPQAKALIADSMGAMERLGKILHKLTKVDKYKTTRYIDQQKGAAEGESRIIEIE